MLNSVEIQGIIPHRTPFLMVDRILELQPGVRAVGIKNVSGNEPYFSGHFPGNPIMPGVLIVEALAQVGAVAVLAMPEHQGKLVLFAGMDKVRFRRPVLPGDQLVLEVELARLRGNIGKGKAIAKVDGEPVAEVELTFSLQVKPSPPKSHR